MNPGIESSFIFSDKAVPITSKCRATFRGLSIKRNHEKRRGGDWKNDCPKWPPSLSFPVRVCISAHQHLTGAADWELAIIMLRGVFILLLVFASLPLFFLGLFPPILSDYMYF